METGNNKIKSEKSREPIWAGMINKHLFLSAALSNANKFNTFYLPETFIVRVCISSLKFTSSK